MPLIATFAFNGAEFWCPYCGKTYGMFGVNRIESTPELRALHDLYEERSKDLLRAKGSQACSEHKIKGKWIKQEDIPQDYRDEMAKIIKEFKYEVKLEVK